MKHPRPLRSRSLVAAALLLASSIVSPALTITLGPADTAGSLTIHEYQTDYAAWLVADLADPVVPAPISIRSDAGAGYWAFQLAFPPGFPDLQTGDTFSLQEILSVAAGSLPLASWEQTILTPGWRWVDGSIFDDATANPLPGLQTSIAGGAISFAFDPVGEGTGLFVAKTLEYTGPAGPANGLSVRAQPVPEPGPGPLTMGLLAVALVVGGFRSPRQGR